MGYGVGQTTGQTGVGTTANTTSQTQQAGYGGKGGGQATPPVDVFGIILVDFPFFGFRHLRLDKPDPAVVAAIELALRVVPDPLVEWVGIG